MWSSPTRGAGRHGRKNKVGGLFITPLLGILLINLDSISQTFHQGSTQKLFRVPRT